MENNEMNELSVDEKVYSLRHKRYGTITATDGQKGCVISFSKNKFDYEYHYPNEVVKHGESN